MGAKIIKTAAKYLGKTGAFVWNYFAGLPYGASWCVGFVLYVVTKAGYKADIYDPAKVASPFWVPTLDEWLYKHAYWVKFADAQEGDIVIFTWSGKGGNTRSGSRDHTGFFKAHDGENSFRTVEGNTSGGKVAERTRYIGNVYAIYRLDTGHVPDPEPTPKPEKTLPAYKKGSTYTVAVDNLNVRTGPGTGYAVKTKSQLTADGQKNANSKGQLRKGTRVTCGKAKTVGSTVWMKIPSGWVCAYNGTKKYVK